ncbi:LamG domain-containing protein [Pseudomonadales bacterium]|nr:LamG domain-containing protein [Pseudomonadales bacterium]
MLGLGSSLLQGGALRSIVRSGLQLFYKADRTQAPLGEEQVKNNSFDEISGNLVSNPTFDLGSEAIQNRTFNLGSEAIQNGTFNLGSEEVQNGEFNELGSDKIDNGNFETGIDGWDPNSGSETTITYNSQLKGIKFSNYGLVGSPTVRNLNSDTVTGETYKLTYKVLENNNASKISIWNGNTYDVYNDLPVNVSDDEHVYYYTFSGSSAPDLYIKLETDESDITLSNIKLEKVDPNNRWTGLKPSGQVVEIVNNQLHINYDASETQATTGVVQYIITPGKTYEISIDIQSITGTLTVLTGGASNNFNTIGVKTFTVTPNSSALFIINPLGGGVYNDMECYINSISVKEVTNWVLDANWSVANNTAIYVGDGNANELLQEISFIGGRTYEIKIDVASISGSLKARFNNHHANKAVFNQTGMQTLYITATGSGNITDDLSISRETGTVNAVLNSVSVKEVPNWSFQNSAWSINNDKALYDGTLTSYINQSGLTISSGKTYQVSFDIEDSSGQSRVQISNRVANETYSPYTDRANGSYVVTFTPSSNQTTLAFKGHTSGGSFSLSNVSLKEVPSWELQSNWSVSENQVVSNGSNGWIKQKNVVDNGESYQVVFSAEVSSGRFRAVTTGDVSTYTPYITESGTYTFYASPTNSLAGGFEFVSDAFDGSISNVFVKQLDPNNRWTVNNDTPSEQTVEIREGSFFIEYDSTATKGTANINVNSAGIVNQKYEIKVVVDSINNDKKLKVQLGNSPHNLSVGTNIFEATSTTSGTLTLGRTHENDSVTATVSSISLRAITNSIKDHSRNSNDGILYSGKALDFDGDGDGVQLNTAHDISILGDYTIALWFKRNNTSNSNNTIYHNSKDTENRTGVHWTADNKITFNTYRSATNYQGINSPVLDKDKWYRVVAVAKGGVKTLYINNENNPTSGGGISSYLPGSNEFLGGENSDYNCDGAVADFQLYDKAWNATDVKYDWENPDKDVFDRVGVAEVLGEELVTNGDFALNSNWSEGVGWDVAGNGFATCDGSQTGTSNLEQVIYTPGKLYKNIITVDSVDAGSLAIFTGTSNSQLTITEAGTYAITIYASTSNSLYIQADASFDGSISNVSVREVTTHASHILPTDCKSLLRLNEGAGDRVYDAAPVLGAEEVQNRTFELGSEEVVDGSFPQGATAWTISSASNVTFGDGFVNILKETGAGSTDAYIYQDILQINKTYQVTFSGVISTGRLFFGTNAVKTNEFLAGTYVNETFNFTTTTTDNFIIRNPNTGTTIDARLTDVSVKEVPNWTLINNTTIVDGVANLVAGGDVGSQTGNWSLKSLNNVFQLNKTYRIKFRAKQVSLAGSNAGAFQLGYAYYALFDQVITNEFVDYEVVVKPSSGGSVLNLTAGGRAAGDVFQIDDISVKEIKPAESFAIVGDKNFIHQQPYIPQYAMSSFSKKMFFDGVNDYVTGSFNGNIGPVKDITFSCWFSYEDDAASSNDRETLFGLLKSSSDDNPYMQLEVGIYEGNRIIVYTGDGGDITTPSHYATSVSSANSLVINKLNHVSVSLSSTGDVKIYINGVRDGGSNQGTSFGAPTATHYRMGARRPSGTSTLFNKGIIDEVSLFKSELTQAEVLELYNSGSSFDSTGHSKYNLGEEVSNGTFELGSEEVDNGDFATDSDWNFGDGWSYVDGKASLVQVGNPQATDHLTQELPGLVDGRTYVVSFDLDITSSTVTTIGLSNTGAFGNVASSLRFHETSIRKTFTAIYDSSHQSGTKELRFVGGSNTEFTIDNVSVKEIPSWELRPGWSVNNNTAVYDGTGSQYARIIQTLSTVVGRTYQMTFTLSGLSSGKTVNFGLGRNGAFNGYTQQTYSSNGTYTRIMQAQSIDDDIMVQVNQADANCTVSNISVQEYGVSGYWRNNGADQWDDLSINSNHGTVSGSPTEIFLQEVPFFGKDSLGMFMNKPRLGGLNFNGSGYVANESMPTISDNISFSFWIKLEDFVNNNLAQVVGKRADGDSRWCRVYRSSDDTLRLEVAAQNSLNFTIPEAEWVHVVTTIDESNLAIAYINGALASQATLTGGFNFLNANDFSIGAWKNTATSTSGTSLLNGIVDDVMVYDETLTLKQVKKNYNATKGKHKN